MINPTPLTSPELTNQILAWSLGEKNAPYSPARLMASVSVFGPRFRAPGAVRHHPRNATEFLGCLEFVRSCGLYSNYEFNRVRFLSPAWDSVVDVWDELARIFYRPAHAPAITFAEKEARYEAALNRRWLPQRREWTVLVPPAEWEQIENTGRTEEIEFLGSKVKIKTVLKELLPPLCLGVMRTGRGAAYMMSLDAPDSD